MSVVLALVGFVEMQASTEAPSCPGLNTLEMNACAAHDVAQSNERLEKYADAARERLSSENDTGVLARFDTAQAIWEIYAKTECDAVYEQGKDGTIRSMMAASCMVSLADQRTYAIWEQWLTYPDSTPPILPEPRPTPDSNMVESP